ncbi:MAG: DUF2167 domain-containing protein [Saprospiraceae bacterium]
MKLKLKLILTICLLSLVNLKATDTLQVNQEYSDIEYQIMVNKFLDSIEQSLTYETGNILLKDNIASIEVPEGFKYLNGKDSEMILTDIWGNPPSDPADQSYGMLIPTSASPLSDSSYSINITYSEEGYIDDADAKDIDYDELLSTIKSETEAMNEVRLENGYPEVHVIGWASPPFYDEANKKLHWAKEAKFGESESNTLNYNIRILGRKGYLQLNAIGEMYVFDEVNNNIAPILESVNFNEGYRYADFNPDMDKVAAYGIGGLIAGKVLAKAGILAKVGILLAKFWKFILIGIVGLFAGVKKFFGKGEDEPELKSEA